MIGRIVVVDDVTTAFADLVVESYSSRSGPTFSLAFSGGSTARDCYVELASRSAIDWVGVDAWWGDERCVPLDDPDSNHRLVHEALLDRVGPTRCDRRMRCGDGGDEYDELLRSSEPIDLVHLGLGPDGHTASLFPGSTALDAPNGRLVVENEDPTGTNPHRRITFTYDAIERARRVVVTVSGPSKCEAFRRVMAGDVTAPASRLRSNDLVWLVDHEALGEAPIGGGADGVGR